MCVTVENFYQNRSNSCGDIAFNVFQYGGCPPSCICWTHFGTTDEEYLVVFIVVQNLIGIDIAGSIIQRFTYFARLT